MIEASHTLSPSNPFIFPYSSVTEPIGKVQDGWYADSIRLNIQRRISSLELISYSHLNKKTTFLSKIYIFSPIAIPGFGIHYFMSQLYRIYHIFNVLGFLENVGLYFWKI